MPSTRLSLHYRLVFSTKDRIPIITTATGERLHAYLGGIAKNTHGIPGPVGGTNDHVHLLIGLRATHCLADVVRDLKAASSRWMHEEIGKRSATWQDGYGAFTVGAPQCEDVRNDKLLQEEHHQKHTFQEEYLEFLRRGGVEYDEPYLW